MTTSTAAGGVPLLERERSLAALAARLAAVREEGSGRLVFVAGEAGAGKTQLLRRFCDEHAAAARVLWGACDPLFTPCPLGPFVDVAQATGGTLGRIVQCEARPYEVATALLRELAVEAPTVLVLEDVHWADEGTLDVLRLLGRRVAEAPVLVIASYRDDALDRAHPLRVVLGELAAERVPVPPLSPEAVALLAEPLGLDAEEVYFSTGGNPFFVGEVLESGPDGIPPTVRDAVLARASRLSPEARTVLDVASIFPEQAELWLLEAVAGDAIEALDECIAAGMLQPDCDGVAYRHELARAAIEESLSPHCRLELHRDALAGLLAWPGGSPDAARVTHHALAAGDAEAVLRFAPLAAVRATAVGAHREAAAQYAHALELADRLRPEERADLLEARSRACYLTDHHAEALEAAEAALELRRALGDRAREGEALRWLSEILWCPGRVAEAEAAGREAVAVLDGLPPGPHLALAYSNLARLFRAGDRLAEAAAYGRRALELAEWLGDGAIRAHAAASLGATLMALGSAEGVELLESGLAGAERDGNDWAAGTFYVLLASSALALRDYDAAARYVDAGARFTSDRGLELHRLYLLSYRARVELDLGRWDAATDAAEAVLRVQRASTTPRIGALVVAALGRARRGEPGHRPLLDEAWELAAQTGELQRIGPVAAARAETALLEGRAADVRGLTESALALAVERDAPWWIGELAVWRRRAGLRDDVVTRAAEPYAHELAGDWSLAAEFWSRRGCRHEAALVRAQSLDEAAVSNAVTDLHEQGAAAVAQLVARRLRRAGARRIPRGPRPKTLGNPANLTPREVEVLTLVADGLPNVEIARRLFLSRRTVDHHVSAILRKLGARKRSQASAEAIRLGIV